VQIAIPGTVFKTKSLADPIHQFESLSFLSFLSLPILSCQHFFSPRAYRYLRCSLLPNIFVLSVPIYAILSCQTLFFYPCLLTPFSLAKHFFLSVPIYDVLSCQTFFFSPCLFFAIHSCQTLFCSPSLLTPFFLAQHFILSLPIYAVLSCQTFFFLRAYLHRSLLPNFFSLSVFLHSSLLLNTLFRSVPIYVVISCQTFVCTYASYTVYY
jgi:hypothetical protein